MPSLAESRRRVKDGLARHAHQPDHDAILAGLQNEIDRHNHRDGDPHSPHRNRSATRGNDAHDASSLRFRFKSGASDARARKRKHRRRDSTHRHRKHRNTRREDEGGHEVAHPFPREPVDVGRDATADSTAAFRDSLFDALADDEGAAYWESVYSQPMHVYPRPAVENANGALEQMSDDEYAAYVQRKMWEKKNPHVVQERDRRDRRRREEEEERARQREDFVRRRQRAAWERAERESARKSAGLDGDADDHQHVSDCEGRAHGAPQRSADDPEQRGYRRAWARYTAAWDALTGELLGGKHGSEKHRTEESMSPGKRIPWPVLSPRPVVGSNVEEFFQHVPTAEHGPTKLQIYKAERVRWHPDKVQQRFGGQADEGTMKLVTAVFQVVDTLLAAERRRRGAAQ